MVCVVTRTMAFVCSALAKCLRIKSSWGNVALIRSFVGRDQFINFNCTRRKQYHSRVVYCQWHIIFEPLNLIFARIRWCWRWQTFEICCLTGIQIQFSKQIICFGQFYRKQTNKTEMNHSNLKIIFKNISALIKFKWILIKLNELNWIDSMSQKATYSKWKQSQTGWQLFRYHRCWANIDRHQSNLDSLLPNWCTTSHFQVESCIKQWIKCNQQNKWWANVHWKCDKNVDFRV